MLLRRRTLVLLVAAAVALASAVAAQAEVVTRQDAAGRTITFDVQATAVDVDWYAGLLANAAHGDEIATVTIRIVPEADVRGYCGADAVACWTQRRGVSTITVPAGKSDGLAATVLHEYGHHLDSARAVDGVEELNGTPVWWATRGIAALLQSRTVAFDYSLGWSHSIAEVFAEDYAYVHTGGFYSIPWLQPPDEALKAALLAELGGATTTPPPADAEPPAARPVTVSASGTVAPRGRRTLPFQLLGPGRHVSFTVALSAARRSRTAGRIEIVCDGATVRTRRIVPGRTATLDVAGLGPAVCEAAVVSTSAARQRYSARLRLAVDTAAKG